jgi:predicted dehydrogenase
MGHVRVGVVGTSWWTDAMYLPALADHPSGSVTAICGRDPSTARKIAERWKIPHVFTDWREMLASGEIDAVIVATPNDTHHPITMDALARGMAVLCEKPLSLDATLASEMVEAADAAGATTMTPFTYRCMPAARWTKQLIDDGYVGRPYHLHLRYFTGYARDGEYSWRFDNDTAGAGVVGDLGTHWIDMARWLVGEIVAVSATLDRFVERAPRPDGTAYESAEDSAVIQCRFENGALGILHVTAVGWEGTPFGQIHELNLHGSAGTLHTYNDWDTVQEVRGVRSGETGPAAVLPIPETIWQGVRHDTVHNTYRDVFRNTESQARAWLSAVAAGTLVQPDLATGARVQEIADAAMRSAREGSRWVETTPGAQASRQQ